ncbi:transporter [Pseudomonas aeruginosa]|uniref:transporter n=1 Tax=Pseudomonas aeruginosa TaxID=287 RepID=UPI001F3A67E1|nr:transporter [Pseudomonas aeruginosa]
MRRAARRLLADASPAARGPHRSGQRPRPSGKLDDWQQQFTDPLLRQMIGYAPALSGAQA